LDACSPGRQYSNPAKERTVNFDDAIKAHSSWKMKLSSYITKPDHSLHASDVSSDGKCDLGKWLQGEGQKHSSLPEYVRLKTDHARFHKAAADIIAKADAGQSMTEEVALGSRSEYAAASTAVINALMAMKAKVH
jgi:Chemoreceptor zinc-binding domain